MVITTMKKLFIVATLVATSLLHAVVPEIEVWSDGKGHYRYLMSDYHIDYPDGKISIKQQEDIIWAAQQKKEDEAFVIAEDIFDYSYGPQKRTHVYRSLSEQSLHSYVNFLATKHPTSEKYTLITPLLYLISTCKQKKITCYNAECCQPIYAHSSNSSISRQHIIDNLKIHIEKLLLVDKCYLQLTYNISEQARKLNALNNPDVKSCEFIDQAMRLRCDLVDAKTISQLHFWKYIKHGFIFEGGYHIQQIKVGLINLGYKKIKHIGKKDIIAKLSHLWLSNKFLAHTIALLNALDLKKEFTAIFAEQETEEELKSAATTATAATALAATAVNAPIRSKL